MTLERYLEMVHNGKKDKSFDLLVRVYNAIIANGIEVWSINNRGDNCQLVVGNKHISISEVYRRNGTSENVSVDIGVYEVTGVTQYGGSLRRLGHVNVPKCASDKVIQNRISKALAMM